MQIGSSLIAVGRLNLRGFQLLTTIGLNTADLRTMLDNHLKLALSQQPQQHTWRKVIQMHYQVAEWLLSIQLLQMLTMLDLQTAAPKAPLTDS